MRRKITMVFLTLCMTVGMVSGCGSPATAGVTAGATAETTAETENAAEQGSITEKKTETASGESSTSETSEEPVNVEGMTMEDMKNTFMLTADTDGMTADEMYDKGQAYEKGDGVVQWYAMAMAYYEAAQTAGNSDAAAAIDQLNDYKKEMLDNSPDGQGDIFDFFRTGVTAGQSGDYEKEYAVAYDDAFFFEDPLYRGIGSLGDLYRDGTGVDQDMTKALTIYEFNAKILGKGNGYTSLGLLYQAESGTYPGIEHSDDKAMKYFELSYQDPNLKETDFKGPRYAGDLYDSGYQHDDGSDAAPDYVKAEADYLIAAAGNDRTFDGTACYKLATYYEEGREGVDQDYDKAAEYYLKAISDENVHATMLGIPQTYLALGRLYENGQGVEADKATAVSYYQKAQEAAQENLDLKNAAGNEAAQSVYDDATEALDRLSGQDK